MPYMIHKQKVMYSITEPLLKKCVTTERQDQKSVLNRILTKHKIALESMLKIVLAAGIIITTVALSLHTYGETASWFSSTNICNCKKSRLEAV